MIKLSKMYTLAASLDWDLDFLLKHLLAFKGKSQAWIQYIINYLDNNTCPFEINRKNL